MDQIEIQEIMRRNPTGLLCIFSKRIGHAVYWQDDDSEESILKENLISGIAQNSIDCGHFTKDELIERLNSVLVQRTK